MPERLLAVIPARGGSKRIPGKNIRPFAGRPLIAYAIAAARESGLFEDVVVSTDSEEVADIASRYGATVPFLRSHELSDDATPVSDATLDVLRRIDPNEARFDAVCQLMANCPLRDAGDVLDSHGQFMALGSPAQISVVRYGWQNPWWAIQLAPGYRLDPLFKERLQSRSQDLPELFCPTGAIWWARSASLRSGGTFHLEGRTGWEMPWQRGIDIDTEHDWVLAECLHSMLQRGSTDPGAMRLE